MSLPDSRWVRLPDYARERPGPLPAGFRAAGVACGLKPSGERDVGLLVSTAPVAIASTGVIGVQLDGSKVNRGIAQARGELSEAGGNDFTAAIRTTDAFPKQAELDVELPSGTVRLCAQAKGAGMISPNFATMLCFVQTDAALSAETCDLLLGVCVKRSFDRISVDGQLSTNDTAILMASGASGVRIEPESEDELRFGQALDALLRHLALLMVRDGEGARRVGRVVVDGGDDEAVSRAARAVADSPLVKAALFGGDPNWGRIAQAVGGALHDCAPLELDIWIGDIQVCARGAAIPHDAEALQAAASGDEVDYTVALGGSGAQAELFFSDLSYEYVRINGEYTT